MFSFGHLWTKTFPQIINPTIKTASSSHADWWKPSKLEDDFVLSVLCMYPVCKNTGAATVHSNSMIYSFKCMFGKVPVQEMCWWDTKMIYLGCFWRTLPPTVCESLCVTVSCGVSLGGGFRFSSNTVGVFLLIHLRQTRSSRFSCGLLCCSSLY